MPSESDNIRTYLENLQRLGAEATEGPWFAAYSAVHSKPISDEYIRIEVEMGDDPAEDDPRWDLLPDARVAFVPVQAGDTPTIQGARDARLIATARNCWEALVEVVRQGTELRDAIEEYFAPDIPPEHFFEDMAVFGEGSRRRRDEAVSTHRTCDNCGVDVRNNYWMEIVLHGRDDKPLHTGNAKAPRDYCLDCVDALALGKWEVLADRRRVAVATGETK